MTRPILVILAFLFGVATTLAGGWLMRDHLPGRQIVLPPADMERAVSSFMRDHPEAFMKAIETYEEEIAYKGFHLLVKAKQRELINDPNSPVIGNPDGDLTIVEFFDYRCPYCQRAAATILGLIEDDPKLRFVLKEYPVLSPESGLAARAALASRKQGKYLPFHVALLGIKGRFDEIAIMRVAAEVGIDTDRLEKDMQDPEIDTILSANLALGKVLGARGTPTFVIGNRRVMGLVTREAFETYIEAARIMASSAN